MATYYQQWTPQVTQDTAYQPIHNPEATPDAPSYTKGKPTEYFLQEHEQDGNGNQYQPPLYGVQQPWYRWYLGGLRRTLVFSLLIGSIVLLINLSWLAYAGTHYGGITSGYGIIQRGDCGAAKATNTWLHLLINVLSTLLLTGSNAFMATYSCPSRKEIDRAHARRKWLHVGMLSFRNLTGIAKRKSLVVLLLCLSSVPFHLLYNSLVFVSLATNNYYWTVAAESFTTGAPYNLTGPFSSSGYFSIPNVPDGSLDTYFTYLPRDQAKLDMLYDYYDGIQQNASSWERLSNHDCIQAYSNVFLGGRRNVVLVSSDTNATDSIFTYDISQLDNGSMDNNWWICSLAGQDGGNLICQPDDYLDDAENWTVFGHPIEYCLSQQVEDVCQVEFSVPIMAIVIVFNSIKVLAMFWVLWRFKAQNIIATVGDAAVSFLTHEDETTRGICLADRKNVARLWRMPGAGVPYTNRRGRWSQAVGKGKWTIFILVLAISFFLIVGFGAWGFTHTKKRGNSLSLSSLWQLGFGAAHQDAVALYDLKLTNTIAMAVLANVPQIFLAVVWLLYMGIMTSMFLAADWARFGIQAQTLMVSSPAGAQRKIWFLNAPVAYGVVLLILQIILHWLVSQSIFVISINIYNPDASPFQELPKLVNCGYSPIAIIFSAIATVLLILSAIALSVVRLPLGGAPVAATCSAAISAACHLPYPVSREELIYEPLRWGQSAQVENGVGHCSLMPASHFEAGGRPPVAGCLYAGLDSSDQVAQHEKSLAD